MSITSDHSGHDARAATDRVIQRAKTAAAAGLDHVSLGDHHAVGPQGLYVQNVPMIGRIMADWPADRPVGLLLLLPLWNPVLAAEQIGTLAAMSDVPFIVQTGIGHGRAQFEAMGVEYRRRGAVSDASIAVMKALLAGEVVDAPEFGLVGAAINPRPRMPVDWWIGSGTGDVPLQRAAREGQAWYIGPGLPVAELAPAIERYHQMCAGLGTRPRVALRRDVFVADDDGVAISTAEQLVATGYRGMNADVLVYGGVERVTERLSALAAIGVDDIVARTINVSSDQAIRSIELLGEVREHLVPLPG